MNNFNEDLREIIKQKQEYVNMRSAFILNKNKLEVLDSYFIKQLIAIDSVVNDNMSEVFKKINYIKN